MHPTTLNAQKRSRSRQVPKTVSIASRGPALKCCLRCTTYQPGWVAMSKSLTTRQLDNYGGGGVDLLLSGIDGPCGLRLLSDPTAISS